MLAVDKEAKNSFLRSDYKDLILVFDNGVVINNEDVALESMNLNQSVCDQDELKFGKVSSACFKVKIKGTTSTYKGLWFNASIKSGEHEIKLGRFCVYSDKATSDMQYRDIVAYDKLFWAMNTDVTEWYDNLTFPISQKDFRDSLCQELGLVQDETVLPNDNVLFTKTILTEKLIGLDVLEALCEMNATWGTINSDGKFRYIKVRTHTKDAIYPKDDLYPDDTLYPDDITDDTLTRGNYHLGSLKYEEFDCKAVTKVTIRQSSDDLGYSKGEDGNTYVIEDNFLLYGASDETLEIVASNFLDYASYLTYTPGQLSCKGAPWREVGDLLKVFAERRTLLIPIYKRTLSGITALKDEYSAGGTEVFGEKKSSPSTKIKQLQSRANKLTRDLDETRSEVSKIETDLSTNYSTTTETKSLIKQSADEISLEVSRVKTDLKSNYPTTENTKSLIKQSADEISAEVSSVEKNLSDNYSTTQETKSLIKQSTDEISSTVSSLEDNLSDNYSTTTQTQSLIKQSADAINLEVAKKVNATEIGAKISLDSAGEIDIKGNRISIESDNFTLSKDGSIVANNAALSGRFSSLSSSGKERASIESGQVTVGSGDTAGANVFIGNAGITLNNTNTMMLRLVGYSDDYAFIESKATQGLYIGTGESTPYYYITINEDGCGEIILWKNLNAYDIIANNVKVLGSLTVQATKSRLVDTPDFGERLLYCYETPSPLFGDIGEGTIDESGKCYIFLDDIFSETIDTNCTYQVFLQAYGKGECYVTERHSNYFVVEGTENLSFGWEIKAVQNKFDTMRLEEYQEIEKDTTDVLLYESYEYLETLLYNVEEEVIQNE
jgi:hypothetical protein